MKRLAAIALLAWVLWRSLPLESEIERVAKEVRKKDRIARIKRILRPLNLKALYPVQTSAEVESLFEQDLRRMTLELAQIEGIGTVSGEVRVDTLMDGTRILVGIIDFEYPAFTSGGDAAILDLLDNGFMYHVESGKFVTGGVL